MKFNGDYHLHTKASDGKTDIVGHVEVARSKGFDEIAITDHSFASLIYHMTGKKFAKQRAQIDALKGCGVKILQGVEGNLIENRLDVPHDFICKCDILLVGFHRFITPSKMMGARRFLMTNGFASKKAKEKLICQNTEAYISVLEKYPVDVISHLGHRAPVDFARVCECAAKHDVYIELNAKHLDALAQGIRCAIDSGVKFIVGTDAHSKKHTGDFGAVEKFIEEYGVPLDRVYGVNGNMPRFKDKKEWSYGNDV